VASGAYVSTEVAIMPRLHVRSLTPTPLHLCRCKLASHLLLAMNSKEPGCLSDAVGGTSQSDSRRAER